MFGSTIIYPNLEQHGQVLRVVGSVWLDWFQFMMWIRFVNPYDFSFNQVDSVEPSHGRFWTCSQHV
jgi:hypothetical protein